MAAAISRKVTLVENVHANKRIELECIREFDSNHFFEDERECGNLRVSIRPQPQAECITLDLALPLSRRERSLAKAAQFQ